MNPCLNRSTPSSSCRHGIRISFNQDIRYARADNLFCPESQYRNDLGHSIVMEIKTQRSDIAWLNRLVRDQDLGPEPNSKYVNAINHTQAAIWF